MMGFFSRINDGLTPFLRTVTLGVYRPFSGAETAGKGLTPPRVGCGPIWRQWTWVALSIVSFF